MFPRSRWSLQWTEKQPLGKLRCRILIAQIGYSKRSCRGYSSCYFFIHLEPGHITSLDRPHVGIRLFATGPSKWAQGCSKGGKYGHKKDLLWADFSLWRALSPLLRAFGQLEKWTQSSLPLLMWPFTIVAKCEDAPDHSFLVRCPWQPNECSFGGHVTRLIDT